MTISIRVSAAALSLAFLAACADSATAPNARVAGPALSGSTSSGGGTSGGGGGGTVKVDQIKVSKCYWISSGEMLIKAASSDATARLFAWHVDRRSPERWRQPLRWHGDALHAD
jgi:hypothetical protein